MQVMRKFKGIRLVTWDTVQQQGMPWSEYQGWLNDHKSPVARFLEAVGRKAYDPESESEWLVCDPMAVAVAIRPDIVESSQVIKIAAVCASNT